MSSEAHARASKGMHMHMDMRSPSTTQHHAAAACQLLSRPVLPKDEAHAAACRHRGRLSRSTAAAARPSTSRKQRASKPWRSISDRPCSAPAARRDAHDGTALATAITPSLPACSGITPSERCPQIHLHVFGVSEGL